jgi:hypothetical protein
MPQLRAAGQFEEATVAQRQAGELLKVSGENVAVGDLPLDQTAQQT